MGIEVITFQDLRAINPSKEDVVITVSKSIDWSNGLSPFVLGPCSLYGRYTATNVENAWQFSKVYSEFVKDNQILPSYYAWAQKGWEDSFAHRYPMGKGCKPLFSVWNGKRMNYVTARKKIYIPLYYNAVRNTEAFRLLQEKYDRDYHNERTLYLIDFDAYRHKQINMSYRDVASCADKKMGHAFVLAWALEQPWDFHEFLACCTM